MGLVITAESEWGKELAKWNTPKRLGGMNTDGGEQFPMCLLKAQRRPDGKWSTGETDDRLFGEIPGSAEQFTRTCQQNFEERQYDRALADGWRKTGTEALDWREKEETRVADIAANRHHQDARLSEQARAHAASVDASTSEHVPVIPVAPRRRGRPRKIATLVPEG